MMTVKFEARGFGPEYQMNGDGHIATTWPELVHSAITVGRRGWRDVLKHGRYSVFENVLSGGDALGQPATVSKPTQEVRRIPEP